MGQSLAAREGQGARVSGGGVICGGDGGGNSGGRAHGLLYSCKVCVQGCKLHSWTGSLAAAVRP